MKLRLLILLAAALAAAPAAGQTIKSLGYNTTNGNIVAATNVTFTNSVGFATNAQAATRTNLGGTTVGNAVFTATNAAAAATAVGLGTTNDVTFSRVQVGGVVISTNTFSGGDFAVTAGKALTFVSGGDASTTRTNLGLGATWLTNTDVTNFRTAIGLGTTNSVTFSNITASGTLAVTGNVTMSGVNNTATQQTADSGASLMTRDLGDDRYGAYENTFEISNFTGLTAGVVSGGTTTTTPGYTTLRVASGGSYRSMFSLYRGSITGASGSIQSGSRSTRAVVGNEIESRVYSAFYPVLGSVSAQWAGRGVGLTTSGGVIPYFLYYDSAWRAIKATFVRGSASVFPVRSSNVITIESNGAHNLTTNDFVAVAGVFPQSMQTWRSAVLSTPTTNTFTYANVGTNETGTTILGDNMNINKIEELGTNAVTVVSNQFSGVVTRDFRVDVSAGGTAEFYINGSNMATGTGFWASGGNNTARMGFGLESQTNATAVSDINIYKASHTINP